MTQYIGDMDPTTGPDGEHVEVEAHHKVAALVASGLTREGAETLVRRGWPELPEGDSGPAGQLDRQKRTAQAIADAEARGARAGCDDGHQDGEHDGRSPGALLGQLDTLPPIPATVPSVLGGQHHTREEILARFDRGEAFVVELGETDTTWDPETGDTLLGDVVAKVTYSRGTFPGATFRASITDRR